MPTESLYVGGQLLPVEAAGDNSALHDPTIVGLLRFYAFWIRSSLNTKLAEMGGPTDSAPVTDACPEEHLFPWNHNGTFMRPHRTGANEMTTPLPGLWMWSEREEWSKEWSTLFYDATARELKLCWVFPQVQIPGGFDARSGLSSAVGRAIVAASSNCRHPLYGHGGDTPGTNILLSLGLQHLAFVRGQAGMMAAVPTGGANGQGRSQSEGAVQRFFPAYEATLEVVERVKHWESSAIVDSMGDHDVVISTGDSPGDTVEALTVTLPAPDDVL